MLALVLGAGMAAAQPALPPPAEGAIRLASYDAALTRKGPGLLLRDVSRGEKQASAALDVIAALNADIVLLISVDWDFEGRALEAIVAALAERGQDYPYRLTAQPNSGLPSGADLDGDGRLGTADDAQGFGFFTGEGGMAVLSRWPLTLTRDDTALLWADLPENRAADVVPEAVRSIQRLSSVNHWQVEAETPQGALALRMLAATPPVFDGPEDRNGKRNADEIALWMRDLPEAGFVLMGKTNLDPIDGEGLREVMAAALSDPRLIDPEPRSEGGARADQGGANQVQTGDPALDTASWPAADGPGNLRVDFVLPSADLDLRKAGVFWPAKGEALHKEVAAASAHRPVWVDLSVPRD